MSYFLRKALALIFCEQSLIVFVRNTSRVTSVASRSDPCTLMIYMRRDFPDLCAAMLFRGVFS